MSLTIYTLDLRSPFSYSKLPASDAFALLDSEEQAVCFSLPGAAAREIEPDPEHYLGPIIFTGILSNDRETQECTIPQGLYLFAQLRETPSKELFTAMAIEVQKEGLWQRLDLAPLVFLRVLKEEDAYVTQVLRPIKRLPSQS